jgi:ribosomal protein L14
MITIEKLDKKLINECEKKAKEKGFTKIISLAPEVV